MLSYSLWILLLSGAGTVLPEGLHVEKANGKTLLSLQGGEVFHETPMRVSHPSLLKVPNSTTKIATWKEWKETGKSSDFYMIALDGVHPTTIRETSFDIKLRFANFDPLIRLPVFPEHLKADNDNEQYIVQFITQPLEIYRDAIEKLGGKISHFLHNHAYVVRMDTHTANEISCLPFVRWVGPFESAYRVDPEVLDQLNLEQGKAKVYNLMVFEWGPTQKESVAQKILSIGGRIQNMIPEGHRMEVVLSPDQILSVIKWNEVMWLDEWSPPSHDMDIAREFGGASVLESLYGYSGEGVRGEVMDTNVRLTHVDLAGRVITHGTLSGSLGHGTSVTGIVFGNGTQNSRGRGLLPLGTPVFASFSQLTNRYQHTERLLRSPYFCVFQTNSWGSSLTRNYTSVSAEMDDIIWRNDILILNSQSNAGNQDSRPQAWAKNIVSVGGIAHRDTLTRNDDAWTTASHGPASDGRLKPDLAHFYDNIFTTSSDSDTSYTSTFGGTSGATPITAGHFGLFFEMWKNGEFNNTAPGTTVFDARPTFTTSKAAIINTASQWTFNGTGHNLSRYKQGWGNADVGYLYQVRNKMFIINGHHTIRNLETHRYRLYVPNGESAFKATLSYRDPAGIANSSVHRINDLTLKVTSPSGTVYWGNNGLAANMWSLSGGAANTVDTVENVFVQNPQTGVWTVEIFGSEIVQDAYVNTPEMDADYSLVVTGVHAHATIDFVTRIRGNAISGGLQEILRSDNQHMITDSGPTTPTVFPPVYLEIGANSPVLLAGQMVVTVETKPSHNNILMHLELYDSSNNRWESIGNIAIPNIEKAFNFSIHNNPSRFIDTNQKIKLRIGYRRISPIPDSSFAVDLDHVKIEIQP